MPALQQVTEQFAGYIRDPEHQAAPQNIEQRRLNIYKDLFYNNIENFISGGFPILRSIIADQPWHQMVRDFMVSYRCQSPYFLEISQEFQQYLAQQPELLSQPGYPPFIQELAHYEWVELALDVAEQDITAFEREQGISLPEDLLRQLPVVSPLAWSLVYQYPVHQIGEGFQPQQPAEQPSFLIVYRDRADEVRFMEANAVTARLIELLEQAEASASGESVLLQLAEEMQHPQPEQIIDSGLQLLQQLLQQDIILGVKA